MDGIVQYIVKCKGLDYVSLAAVTASAAKRTKPTQASISETSSPPAGPIPAEMLSDYEAFQLTFEAAVEHASSKGYLDLGEAPQTC